ncbi:BamA/TamA family outer membrane protein [Pedobacter mendelii]|uniref:Membrane protein n=1 Tax=Pedobacter mendelii TaxID=1908240 RepID=A0ABQ2BEW0_9SPHI|nr:BamA/TamA family outer membrane protein [Pedobacter mendelii]GGI22503.1 membrane protein [Pedobacter mendelii]
MKKLAILFSLLLIAFSGMAQMKLIKKMLSNEKDTTRKASFLPIPAFGYSQETGFEFGVGAIYSFYTNRKDTLTRSSNFSANATYSTKKTYNVALKGDAWSKGNIYHAIGEIRFKKMPFNFYGLGNNTSKIDEDKLVQQQIKVAFDLEKTFIRNAYTGISLGFENYDFIDQVVGGIFSSDPSILGKTGGKVIFTGVSQSYDTRNSNNYPSKGFFGRISYQYAPDFFGGNNFNGSQIKLNLRNFWKLSNKFILGTQGLYHTVQSDNTPFYLLPQLGNDEMMRGYYTGRYRDKNLLALQAELRYRYNNRFGTVLFAGTGTVWGKSDFALDAFKPNLGGGLRYFFDPAKGLSIRLDYGIGEKKENEKRQSGFYISLAEAF